MESLNKFRELSFSPVFFFCFIPPPSFLFVNIYIFCFFFFLLGPFSFFTAAYSFVVVCRPIREENFWVFWHRAWVVGKSSLNERQSEEMDTLNWSSSSG